jgi:hypothetical protein
MVILNELFEDCKACYFSGFSALVGRKYNMNTEFRILITSGDAFNCHDGSISGNYYVDEI